MDSRTIPTTIGALVQAQPALEKLITLKLESQTRYHAMKLAKLVRAEVTDHFHEPRQAIMRELGEERPPTPEERQANPAAMSLIVVPTEKMADLNAQMKAIVDVQVTIPWGPITAAMIEPVQTDFTAEDMLALGPLFDDTLPDLLNTPKTSVV